MGSKLAGYLDRKLRFLTVIPYMVRKKVKSEFGSVLHGAKEGGASSGHHKSKRLKYKNVINILLCLFVRVVYLIEAILLIYFLVRLKNSWLFLILLIPLGLITCDGAYLAAFKFGIEYSWFSLSTYLYTVVMLMGILFISSVKIQAYEFDHVDCAQLRSLNDSESANAVNIDVLSRVNLFQFLFCF